MDRHSFDSEELQHECYNVHFHHLCPIYLKALRELYQDQCFLFIHVGQQSARQSQRQTLCHTGVMRQDQQQLCETLYSYGESENAKPRTSTTWVVLHLLDVIARCCAQHQHQLWPCLSATSPGATDEMAAVCDITWRQPMNRCWLKTIFLCALVASKEEVRRLPLNLYLKNIHRYTPGH